MFLTNLFVFTIFRIHMDRKRTRSQERDYHRERRDDHRERRDDHRERRDDHRRDDRDRRDYGDRSRDYGRNYDSGSFQRESRGSRDFSRRDERPDKIQRRRSAVPTVSISELPPVREVEESSMIIISKVPCKN